jgi:hypothetical protein
MANFIDDLHRKLRDAQFQVDRLLKRHPLDRNFLCQLAKLTSDIKTDLKSLQSTSQFGEFIDELAVLDPDFQPAISIWRKITGTVTFGWSTKRFIYRSQLEYTISTVKQLKEHYAYLERHLSEL